MKLSAEQEAAILKGRGVLSVTEGQAKSLVPPDPPMPDDVSEKLFQANVIAFAKANGWKVFDRFDARKGRAGWPDLVLVRGRVIYFWELKTATGQTTAEQDGWLESLAHALSDHTAARVEVIRPNDWPLIVALLEAP